MRVLNRSTALGTTLVALAILNFSVLDQVGVGLVDSVNAKFEELGAEWVGIHVSNPQVDAAAIAQEIATIPGVRSSVSYWSTNVLDFGSAAATSPSPGRVIVTQATTTEYVMVSDTYDLNAHPYLFVFHEESETQAKFYRDAITWLQGSPPGPGEVALSTDTANEAGVAVGDTYTQAFGANPFNPAGVHAAHFTVSGIYQRAYADPAGNPPEIVIVGPNPELRAARLEATSIVIVQASLPEILRVVDDAIHRIEAMGHSVSTERFQGRPGGMGRQGGGGGQGGFGGGGGGFGGGGQGGFGGGAMAGQGPSDVLLFANGEVLASALAAAERAGTWFRLLTTSAVVLAVLGIAFVTAAMERKVRRDVGIRQAVGYPIKRIYLHWATVAATMGLAGAAVGIGLVYTLSASGLAPILLGLDLSFRSSAGILAAPFAAVAVYGVATLPTYWRVLRSSPAENLRVVQE